MKKTKTVEVECCDWCGGEATYYRCRECRKVACGECEDNELVEMNTMVHCTGGYDFKYCHNCYNTEKVRNDEVTKESLKVKALIREYRGFCEDFQKRKEASEKRLQELLSKARE